MTPDEQPESEPPLVAQTSAVPHDDVRSDCDASPLAADSVDVVGDEELPQTSASGDDSPSVAGELAAMASALERFHSRAEQYESIIRRMQSRVEELQADQVRELLKPVIVKLAALHTEASAAEVRAAGRADDSARKDYDYFVSELEETLSLLDVESIGVVEGDVFDAAKHAARRRVDTDDVSLDRRIAKVVRQGFSFVGADRVLLPAMVTVYRHQTPGVDGVPPIAGNAAEADIAD